MGAKDAIYYHHCLFIVVEKTVCINQWEAVSELGGRMSCKMLAVESRI